MSATIPWDEKVSILNGHFVTGLWVQLGVKSLVQSTEYVLLFKCFLLKTGNLGEGHAVMYVDYWHS